MERLDLEEEVNSKSWWFRELKAELDAIKTVPTNSAAYGIFQIMPSSPIPEFKSQFNWDHKRS